MAPPAPRVTAPVVLGCCVDAPRCALCNPPPAAPTPELVAALLEHYRARAAGLEAEVQVGFFGGPPPADAWLDALDGAPFACRVRPDLLTRADLARLLSRGLQSLELDLLTWDDAALRAIGRRHRGALARQQLAAIRAAGVRAGVVLAPGLPGTDHGAALRDAEQTVGLVDFARVHPVLVLDRSALRELHATGRYAPLDLAAAVTVCRGVLDVLEPAGIEVVRVGQQPGPDGLGRAVAGPRHPALRQLVEARRRLERLRAALDDRHSGAHVLIRCAPGDETPTRGPRNQNLRALRAEFRLASLRIVADPALERGVTTIERLEKQ